MKQHPCGRVALRRSADRAAFIKDKMVCPLLCAWIEEQAKLAAEFDAIHTVGRALDVGSLQRIVAPSELRPFLVREIASALGDRLPKASEAVNVAPAADSRHS